MSDKPNLEPDPDPSLRTQYPTGHRFSLFVPPLLFCHLSCSELGKKMSNITLNNNTLQFISVEITYILSELFFRRNLQLRFGSKILKVTSMFQNDVPMFFVFMVPGREPLTNLPDKSSGRLPIKILCKQMVVAIYCNGR